MTLEEYKKAMERLNLIDKNLLAIEARNRAANRLLIKVCALLAMLIILLAATIALLRNIAQ